MAKSSRPVTNTVLNAALAISIVLLPLAGAVISAGCSGIFGDDEESDVSPNRGVGEECNASDDCRAGLVCSQRTCQPAGDRGEGLSCSLTGECADGLYCSPLAICAQAGEAGLGESCTDTGDCQKGFYCVYEGLYGACHETGTGDLGDACTSSADCLAGLGCSSEQTCLSGLAGVPFFEGGVCPDPEIGEAEPFHVLFDVPRSGEDVGEFYSLPFPNDIRMRSNGLDLSGHFRPDLGEAGDVVTRIIEVIEDDVDGFGLHQATFFRFNDFFQTDPPFSVGGENPDLYLVDIDPDSPEYGRRLSLVWSATGGRGKFICHNWLAVRPFWNQPFRPGTTYAAILTTGVLGPGGEVPTQSNDFAIVIGDQPPSDADLLAAWEAYQPLRDFLDDEDISADTIAGAAVFTTATPADTFDGVRDAVAAAPTPTFGDLVLCDEGVTSPCDDNLGEDSVRGCFAANDAFYEIHTRVEIPRYQEGTPPYLEEGGAVLFNDAGLAIEQGSDDVCVAITIPKDQTMPEDGWPVVVYAHGTGGSFRGFVDSVAADLSAIGYAVVGYEGVLHGDRAGDTDVEPERLFFNFQNLRASLGNVLQGGADVLLFGRFAAELHIPAATSPTDESIRFNPERVAFFGHSQGGLVAVPALAKDDVYGAAVLSGTGGGLLLSLLEKSTPVDVAGAVRVVLWEGRLTEAPPEVDDFHPVLNLLQMYYEPVDGLNYAPEITVSRPEELGPVHLLQTYGLGDTATPPRTMEELAHALAIPVLSPMLDDIARPTIDPPVEGNLNIHGDAATALQIQYQPTDPSRGHFVVFDLDVARDHLAEFLTSFAETGTATVTSDAEGQ